MQRTQHIVCSLLITVFAVPAALVAQPTTATFSGIVTDQSSAMVPAPQVGRREA